MPLHLSTASSELTNTGIGSPLSRFTISRPEGGTNGIPTKRRPTAITIPKTTTIAIMDIVLRDIEILAAHYYLMAFETLHLLGADVFNYFLWLPKFKIGLDKRDSRKLGFLE